VKRLRHDVLPPLTTASGATAHVGGYTATEIDVSALLAAKLPLFIGVVVILSALLLLVVFRSLLIPVQAAVMNLLSIGASLGVAQAVFERGWFGSLIGAHPAPISGYIPVMVFAVVFGLSMDYEVFLVSRVRVFGAFASTNDPIIKLFGFTMAFAVFLDAFVIRSVLLPAVLEIAGRWTWRLPGWLDRWLPNLDLEVPAPAPADVRLPNAAARR
jgi:RND superfamily putative drug exporter